MELLAELLLPIALGVAGWWIANCAWRPIHRLNDLRRDIYVALVDSASIGRTTTSRRSDEAQTQLRHLAAKLEAFHALESKTKLPTLYTQYAKVQNLLPSTAAQKLFGLSECPHTEGGLHAIYRDEVEVALRLPRTLREEVMTSVKDLYECRSGRSALGGEARAATESAQPDPAA